MDEVDILGVKVNKTSYEEILRIVKKNIEEEEKIWIATPNPEIVLKAVEDKNFMHILNSADIRISDGIGLTTAAFFNQIIGEKPEIKNSRIGKIRLWISSLSETLNKQKVNSVLPQVSGDVLFEKLLDNAKENNWSVFLLGGSKNSAIKSEQIIREKYGIEVNSNSGAKNIRTENNLENEEIINEINNSKPHILFVAYGAPWQEKWIYENLEKLKINMAMGVGGTIDEYAGGISTPHVFRNNGFRWLWRLIREPKRIRRICNATIIFSNKFIQ